MNILLVHPQYLTALWSFKYALKFIAKKASLPPLGLLTVSDKFPTGWNRRRRTETGARFRSYGGEKTENR